MMVAAPTTAPSAIRAGISASGVQRTACGLVGLGGADLVSAPREVQLVGAVGGAGHGLEGQDVLDGPGPVPGFFLDFAGGGGRAVFTWVDVAAGEFPDPPVDDEPVPPDQQHPVPGIVEHDGHRAPGQAHDVLVEGRAVGQLDGRDAQPDVRILVHDAVGVDRPACLLLVMCHSARLPALRCPGHRHFRRPGAARRGSGLPSLGVSRSGTPQACVPRNSACLEVPVAGLSWGNGRVAGRGACL